MLKISRTGSVADVIAQARDIPARVIPYAAATALTRTAKLGQAAIIDAMPRVFSAPTRYTLGSTRIVPASIDNLTARVAVKDVAGGGATRPESYMAPGVFGGQRSEKRFEKSLRYAGILARGQYAMPGAAAKLDASGNVSRATISQILKALKAIESVNTKGKRKGGGRKLKNDLFVGTPSVGRGAGRRARAGSISGIWRREGDSGKGEDRRSRLRPLFIFGKSPTYSRRLDFDGVVSAVVLERFRVEFERASASILSKRR